MKILADATLPHVSDLFSQHFEVSYYHTKEALYKALATHDILLCRSTQAIHQEHLIHTPIQCVATASSGTDHIDLDYLQKRHISLFDARGSNAHAVADYILATLAWLEKNHILNPHARIGIIGVGAVGQIIANRLHMLNYQVIPYDPLRNLGQQHDLFACNALLLHANLHDGPLFPSRHFINHDFCSKLRPKTIIINAARGEIVDEIALLKNTQSLIYCTDVYAHEPMINPDIVEYSTLCTPHIAGHSIEAKSRAVIQLAHAIYTHYQLPTAALPSIYTQNITSESWSTHAWIDWVLKQYNPVHESILLKAAQDKSQEFLKLRAAHQHRHEL